MAQNTIEKKLYDLLTTKNFDNFKVLDSTTGKPPIDPTTGQEDLGHADLFTFDWSGSAGKNYGTAVILLNADGQLEIYYGNNLGKGLEESADKSDWFDFLYQLKQFSTRNFKTFAPKDLNQLRLTLQGQSAISEGLFESWSGTRTTSWNGKPQEARLMIKHKRAIGEGDARYRYIESLFIETADEERYKLPFKSLSAGKAMLEHVRQGGRPYDLRGSHIVEMVTELNVLSRFRRAHQGQLFEGDTAELINEAEAYQDTLKHRLKSLSTNRGYTQYFESWNPAEITEEDVVIEGLKHLFVTQNIDSRIESALPLLARIQQQGLAMKEANIFESWASRLMEGTWEIPETPEQQEKLIKLLSAELPVGPDASNATEQLYDLIGDDELFDRLEALAEKDPNADAVETITTRLQELSKHPAIEEVLRAVGGYDDNEENLDIDMNQGAPAPEDEVNEIKDPAIQTEDPAGTAQPTYPEYQDDLSSVLKHAGVPETERPAPDYEDGLDLEEGKMKDIGTAHQDYKNMSDIEFIKAYGQSKEQWFAKHKDLIGETDGAGVMSPIAETTALQGQYGHSGKLQKFEEIEEDVVVRLRELSGLRTQTI